LAGTTGAKVFYLRKLGLCGLVIIEAYIILAFVVALNKILIIFLPKLEVSFKSLSSNEKISLKANYPVPRCYV